jgi:hypothetical protein
MLLQVFLLQNVMFETQTFCYCCNDNRKLTTKSMVFAIFIENSDLATIPQTAYLWGSFKLGNCKDAARGGASSLMASHNFAVYSWKIFDFAC